MRSKRAGLGVLVLLVLVAGYLWRPMLPMEFDSEVWKSRDYVARGRMLDSLKRALKPGTSVDAAIAILGVGEAPVKETRESECLAYYLEDPNPIRWGQFTGGERRARILLVGTDPKTGVTGLSVDYQRLREDPGP